MMLKIHYNYPYNFPYNYHSPIRIPCDAQNIPMKKSMATTNRCSMDHGRCCLGSRCKQLPSTSTKAYKCAVNGKGISTNLIQSNLSIDLPIYLSVYLSIYLPIYLSVYLSICLSIYLSIYLI